MTQEREFSNGQLVYKGEVAASRFLLEVIEKNGGNHRFSGSIEDLENLTKEHLNNWEPGVGSVDGDVRLVNLPVEGFFTDIVEITEDNSELLRVKYEARVEGEASVPTFYFDSDEYAPASFVQIVVYRADVLARDNNRSNPAEWEIVAILANPKENVPMHPITMARNSAHEKGGTKREYTSAEWLEATLFWQRHAVIRSAPAF